MRRPLTLVLAGALALAGCLGGPADDPVAAPETPPPDWTVSPSPVGVDLDIVTCADPPDEWLVLCEVYDLLQTEPLEPADDQTLAESAIETLEEVADQADPADAADAADGPVTCVAPAEPFVDVCATYAERWTPDGETDLIDALVAGTVRGLGDPYSVYANEEAYEQVQIERRGSFEGIGAFVRIEPEAEDPEEADCPVISEECPMRIAGTVPGSPAESVGLRAGDTVVAVDGEPVDGLTLSDAADRVRGPEGTRVTLTVAGENGTNDIDVTRASVELPLIESELVDDVAYLRLFTFRPDAPEAFLDAWQELLAAGARELVIDLRDNPGGSLDAVVRIADEFLDAGVVVLREGRNGPGEERSEDGGALTDERIPVTVLVNRGSASASEILAGTLQERDRATVVGEDTFGKGLVQQEFRLESGGALTVTIANWLTAGGTSFQDTGVQPDVEATIEGDDPADVVAQMRQALANQS